MQISMFCAVKDRPEPLKFSILSWLYRPVNEIVILDWGSERPVRNIIENKMKEQATRENSELNDWQDRIKLLRLPRKHTWTSAKSINIAASYCSNDTIFKIDADNILVAETLPELPENTFYNGSMKESHENDRCLCGSFIVKANDYWKIGGYDERHQNYGYDDQDLYNRLKAKGLQRQTLPQGTIYHLPHSNRQRLDIYRYKKSIWDSIKENKERFQKYQETDPWGPDSPHVKTKIVSDQGWYKEIELEKAEGIDEVIEIFD